MLKKFLLFSLFMFGLAFTLKVDASSSYLAKGHSDLVELEFYNQDAGYKFLYEMSNDALNKAYKKVPKAAFGWSGYAINSYVPCWYISEVIFSKSNNTSSNLTYNYTLKFNETNSKTISRTGSFTGKISGKVKGISLALDSTFKRDVETSVKTYYEEQTKFNVVVPRGKKVSLLVRGDAEVSTCVFKYYLFGIQVKKDTWENLDKITEYYELYEEDF